MTIPPELVTPTTIAGLIMENNKNNKDNNAKYSISPRVLLGTENGIFWNTGDEHTEEGHITEDPDN